MDGARNSSLNSLIGPIFRSLIHGLTLSHLWFTVGLAQLLRLSGALLSLYVSPLFHNQWPSRFTLGTERVFRRMYSHIVAQALPIAYAPAVDWAQGRQRRGTFLAQFALALTIVLVCCVYLIQRGGPPISSLVLQPAPVPVPVPTTCSLPPCGADSLMPALERVAIAPMTTQSISRGTNRVPDALAGQSALALRIPTSQEQPAVPMSDPFPVQRVVPNTILSYTPDTIWSYDFEMYGAIPAAGSGFSSRPSMAGLSAIQPVAPERLELHDIQAFISRPSMAGLSAILPVAARTPMVGLRAIQSFVSRPHMAGLRAIREKIDEARASQSFEVDVDTADTSDQNDVAPLGLIVAGREWPTFIPPAPADGDHYWLEPPFSSGFNQKYSPGYQFGSTGGGRYRIHHGIDIANATGTPILATAAGEVIHAGPDDPTLLGPYNNFYGNSVVIRLGRPFITGAGEQQDIYVLYGHLVSVEVQLGQWVEVGDLIGGVGMTGIAIGPHLHLEVRLGQNSYLHTVNPALWVRPAPSTGTIAVRLLSADNRSWADTQISVYRYDEDGPRWFRTIETYPEQESIAPDPSWGENGAISNIPAGQYYIVTHINDEKVSQDINVRAGETSFIELRTSQ